MRSSQIKPFCCSALLSEIVQRCLKLLVKGREAFQLINNFRQEQDHVELEIERHIAGVNQPESSKNKYVQLTRGLQVINPTYANTAFMEYLRGVAHNLEL